MAFDDSQIRQASNSPILQILYKEGYSDCYFDKETGKFVLVGGKGKPDKMIWPNELTERFSLMEFGVRTGFRKEESESEFYALIR